MLGTGRLDRHPLLHVTSKKLRWPGARSPPARAGSFFGALLTAGDCHDIDRFTFREQTFIAGAATAQCAESGYATGNDGIAAGGAFRP